MTLWGRLLLWGRLSTCGGLAIRLPRTLSLLLAAALLLSAQTPVSAPARALHTRSLVFDGHVHAVDRVFYHGGDIGRRKDDGQFDLPRAKEGGLGALFFSIFVTEDYYPARLETKQALRMLDCALEQIARNSPAIEIARTAADIERIRRAGRIAAVLDISVRTVKRDFKIAKDWLYAELERNRA